MSIYKIIALVIVVLVIGYNIYDYFQVRTEISADGIKNCSNRFILTNPSVDSSVANEYCKCVLIQIGDRYKNSEIKAEKILENENAIMQDWFDQAKQI